MDIGLFGHSIANWGNKESWHYITKLQDHFEANIVNSGCPMCSEERILFQLKKLKKIDLAIIFHADPLVTFIPSWNRDVHTFGREVLEKKFKLKQDSKLEEIKKGMEMTNFITLWCSHNNIPITDEFIKQRFDSMFNLDFNLPVISVLSAIAKEQNTNPEIMLDINIEQTLRKLIEPYLNQNTFFKELVDALVLNKKYLYHPDLQQSRYYGALLQVDQYLSYKQIPTIHCLGKDYWYPSWFNFTSGIVDKELATFQEGKTSESSVKSPEGNAVMFEKLLELISAARSKEVIH